MLDNKNLDPASIETLLSLGYEQQVQLYDRLCAPCPFSDVRIIENKIYAQPVKNLNEAILKICSTKDNEKIHIYRGCKYGGEEHSLQEIMQNSCRLWNKSTIEIDNVEDCFIVLEVEDE